MLQTILMDIKNVQQKILIIFLMSFMFFYTIQNTVFGEVKILDPDIHQVFIQESADEPYPDFIEVEKGDTLIWYNQGTPQVRIRFLTALGIVCNPIINFNSDTGGIFVSDEIPQGGFASLCLINEGVFDYEIVRLNTEGQELAHVNIIQGKVIVE